MGLVDTEIKDCSSNAYLSPGEEPSYNLQVTITDHEDKSGLSLSDLKKKISRDKWILWATNAGKWVSAGGFASLIFDAFTHVIPWSIPLSSKEGASLAMVLIISYYEASKDYDRRKDKFDSLVNSFKQKFISPADEN